MNGTEERRAGEGAGTPGSGASALRCDFCGSPAARVRRVALDRDYDRLQQPHRVRYACPTCSAEKERSRLGLRRG